MPSFHPSIPTPGERFRHVLNFLRCSSLPSFDEAWRYQEIMEEADFFAIDELREVSKSRTERAGSMTEVATSIVDSRAVRRGSLVLCSP